MQILGDISLGDIVTADIFDEGDYVTVVGNSKGKGFQGVVKRHNFRGVGDATHGQHNRLRAPGSIGAASYPARVFKGMRMAGQMGDKRVKIDNLQVLKILLDKNMIVVKGAVPGPKILHNNRKIMKLAVHNIKGKDTKKRLVLIMIFGIEPNNHAIYLDVKQYLAAQRSGTHKTKGNLRLKEVEES